MKSRNTTTFLSKMAPGLLFGCLVFLAPLGISAQTEVNTPSQAEPVAETPTAPVAAEAVASKPVLIIPESMIEPDTAKFTSWQSLGPSGGDIRTVTIDPKNKNNIYASTLDSQVYGSRDGGRTWRVLGPLRRRPIIFVSPRLSHRAALGVFV